MSVIKGQSVVAKVQAFRADGSEVDLSAIAGIVYGWVSSDPTRCALRDAGAAMPVIDGVELTDLGAPVTITVTLVFPSGKRIAGSNQLDCVAAGPQPGDDVDHLAVSFSDSQVIA